jgi:hypothetical protein
MKRKLEEKQATVGRGISKCHIAYFLRHSRQRKV